MVGCILGNDRDLPYDSLAILPSRSRSGCDAVAPSTGAEAPRKWLPMRQPRFGGSHMKTVTVIGLDIAKSVFQVHGIDAAGKPVIRKQLKRARVIPFFAKLPSCVVGIEACASSHYWARELTALGHDVKLMPPAYVKPYVKRQKNDAADAEAICEAGQRPNMRFVPVKQPEQQAGLALHRTRHLLIRQLTAVTNSIRAHLAEFGIVAPVGRRGVDALIAVIHDDRDDRIPELLRTRRAGKSPQRTHPCSRPEACRVAPLERNVQAARCHPRRGSGACDCTCCKRRRPQSLPLRTGFLRLDWFGAEAKFKRRPGQARQHHEGGGPVSAISVLRRCACRDQICAKTRNQASALAGLAAEPQANKGRRHRAC